MAKSPVKSIRDTDSAKAAKARKARAERARWGRKARMAALGAGGVVALGACGYFLFWPGGPSASAGGTQAPDGQSVQLLVDGWSLATLEDRAVTAQWGGGPRSTVTFEPVTSSDIKTILGSTPQVIEAALARQLIGSPSLSCTVDGCTADGADVSAQDLLLGGSSSAASRLHDHGIESGLWKAHVPSDGSGSQLTVTAQGYSSIVLPAAGTLVEQDTEEPLAAEPSLGNGFQQGRWLLSAGLGQVFVPDPAWLGATEDRTALSAVAATPTPEGASALVAAKGAQTVAASGLGAPLAVASQWSASQLTLATSPAKGCAAGVLCYPGTLDVAQDVATPQFFDVTSPSGSGAVLFDDRTVRVSLPAPIMQAGIDGEVAGEVSLRFVTVSLFTGADVSATDWAGLVELDDTQAYTPQDALGAVRLVGDQWSVAP